MGSLTISKPVLVIVHHSSTAKQFFESSASEIHMALSPERQITYHEGPRVTYSATDGAWNWYASECYFCHRCFNRIHSLNQHLNSPVHQQKEYHCPNRECGKQFVTLAAMCNHLESESCEFMRFEKVNKFVGKVIGSNRMITFG